MSSLDAEVTGTSTSYSPEVPFPFLSFCESVQLGDNLTAAARLEGLLGLLLVAHEIL